MLMSLISGSRKEIATALHLQRKGVFFEGLKTAANCKEPCCSESAHLEARFPAAGRIWCSYRCWPCQKRDGNIISRSTPLCVPVPEAERAQLWPPRFLVVLMQTQRSGMMSAAALG